MKKIWSSQTGFSTLFVYLITALVVIGVGTVGYTVYHSDKTTKSLSSTVTSPSTAGDKSTASTNAQSQQTATSYLNVTQWNIKLPLSNSISDAYYFVPVGISDNADGQPSAIAVGLTSLNSSCGATPANVAGYGNSLGAIIRALPTDTDPVSGQLISQKYPGGVTIDGYYYGYSSRTAGKTCASATTLNNFNSSFTAAVQEAQTTATAQ